MKNLKSIDYMTNRPITQIKTTLKKNPPKTALILGSGWNKVISKVKIVKTWGYEDLFQAKSTVPGHKGQLVYGLLAKKPVLIMAGRFHVYEGHTSYEATEPIRLFKKLGIKNLITTCACGGLNPKYKVGDFTLVTDLITLFCQSPLKGAQFQNMSDVYSKKLSIKAQKIMTEMKLPMQKGVYVYYPGPNYETPADKMALHFLGADIVGMSTVPEITMANWLGIKCLSIAFVTNLAFVVHDHQEVLDESKKAAPKMVKLLTNLIKEI